VVSCCTSNLHYWLVGAGLSISRWASEIAGLPAPKKCDIPKTNWDKVKNAGLSRKRNRLGLVN
jgi:hypothetical protein